MSLKFVKDIDEINYKVYCKLKARNGNEFIVGIFKTIQDCKEFEDIYRNMKVIIPVYSNNELTKEYFINLAY